MMLQREFIMLTTSNLLTAFMLGGWLAVTPAAIAANATYSIHNGTVQGSAQAGDLRMAGSIPASRTFHWKGRRYSASRTMRQSRIANNNSYGNLNQ
jgi:hypothetical protein